MAVLRPVEERDARGGTTRVNPTIVFKQDQMVRIISGSNSWRMEENPLYHPPITAQVQNGKICFFDGIPDTSLSRAGAKDMKQSNVPEYILETLKKNPIKFREVKPTVFEVKLATVGDVEVTELTEVPSTDGHSVTITAVEPDLRPNVPRNTRKVMQSEASA